MGDRVSGRDRDHHRSSSHRDRDRDRDHKHHRHHHHTENDDDRRQRSRAADSPPDLNSNSRIRDSVERNRDKDRVSSRKRKDQDYYNDDVDESVERKRSRGSGERKERRRRFEEDDNDREEERENKVNEEELSDEGNKKRKERRRRFEEEDNDREEERKKTAKEEELSDEGNKKRKREGRRGYIDDVKAKEEEEVEEGGKERRVRDKVKEEGEDSKAVFNYGVKSNGASVLQVVSPKQLCVAPDVSISSSGSIQPLPTKVYSVTTTNENEGVSIIRSDEVHGKSSTDGTTTTTSAVTSKSTSLSLDALAKAKRALQMQKELSAKLKKIPALNKLSSTRFDKISQVAANKDGRKLPSSVVGSEREPSVQVTSSSASLPAGAGMSLGSTSGLSGVAATGPAIEAVKRAQELALKMGYRQDPEFAPLINMFPGSSVVSEMAVPPQKPSKAPVLRLDAQGREIDEHGNVINLPKLTNLSTLKVNINKQKKEAFQILKPDLDADVQENPHFDARMGINKTKLLRPKRMSFQFVEEGKWAKQAEYMKIKNQFGEAQSKELKVKQSQLAKAKAEPDDNPNLIAIGERIFPVKKKDEIPDIEWWDKPLLPSGSYSDDFEEMLNMDKITIYIEHPRPIEPPAEPAPPPPQPLKLTKKEQKKLRTQRRLAKERDRQEMIRQGLLEPPKSKVKMSNLMKVLGSEATQDPTRLEMEIRTAAAEREQAHVDRNIARKLTPAERREKKERKLFDDPNTLETLVSVYKINDLSHPQTRFKVDVNAQENRLSGCAVISDGISVVVVEGVKKSIKRYGKLMLKRINWAAAVGNDDDADDEKVDAPVNSCALVWQGSVAKPNFHRFLVHQCRSDAAARKFFSDAGVPHYWDLAVNYSDELM